LVNKNIISVLLLILLLVPLSTASAETEKKEIDLITTPEKVFFNVNNSKPGDVFIKTLNLKNNGTEVLKYLFSNRFLTGDKKFYDELLLKVEDSEGILYEGKLKDFEKLEARELKSGDSEDLVFFIEFPYELGNEYQGLSTEFQFKFYVEGTLGGIIPVDNRLPTTATNMFNYLVAGAALVTGGGALMIHQKKKKLKQDK
jgi:LPXTG-motif cell wall-anchored protein